MPEPIDYFNNTVKVMTEYARKRWGIQIGYTRFFFQNNTGALTFDNPFRTTDCVAPNGCTARPKARQQAGWISIPDNHANYFNFAGSFLLMKHLRLLASINAGWLRQNDPFVPYTTNCDIAGRHRLRLPASSLHGEKQTLAMNYKLIQGIGKKFESKQVIGNTITTTTLQCLVSHPCRAISPRRISPARRKTPRLDTTGKILK